MTHDAGPPLLSAEDLPAIEKKIRAALRRSRVNRREVERRMQRIVRAATTLMDPRVSLVRTAASISVAEVYAALLMVAVADTFRDTKQPGIVGDFYRFTSDDIALLQGVFVLLHERYFGFSPYEGTSGR